MTLLFGILRLVLLRLLGNVLHHYVVVLEASSDLVIGLRLLLIAVVELLRHLHIGLILERNRAGW